MSLEVAIHISDLQQSNPLSTDRKGQGDDHLRLIKSVLKTTLPNADHPFRFPSVNGASVDTLLTEASDNATFFAGASITVTLPTPVNAGWAVRIVKTAVDNNPVYVVGPGTINGFAKIRLNVPYEGHTFVWTGTTFIRLTGAGVAGQMLPFCGPAAPNGFAFPVGQSLLRADFPELFSAWGTTWGAADGTHFSCPDPRDRFLVGAGSTYALGATGGEATHLLATTEMPAHSHTIAQNPHDHSVNVTGGTTGLLQIGNDTAAGTSPAGIGAAITVDVVPANADISINNTGGGAAHENRPPYLGVNHIFRLC